MRYTVEILNRLEVDKNLIKLVVGDINIPYIEDDFQSPTKYWHPHPPVLVPIFVNHGFHYYGILKHWFIERQKIFVEFEAEWGSMVEYARNTEQFFSLMILMMDMVVEKLDDNILEFAKNIDFDNSKNIDLFAEQYGGDSDFYSELESFANNMPLTYLNNIEDYKGDYPSSEKLINQSAIHKSCSFEVVNKDLLTNINNLPEWFNKDNNKKNLFDKYVKEDNLAEAWLTLNSIDDEGMTLPEIAEGLRYLKTRNDDLTFHLIVDNWIYGWQNSSFYK